MHLRSKYENLIAFQKGRAIIKAVYSLTNDLPSSEHWGLTAQMRRASVSVLCNIAEGLSRSSNNEKLRFIEIAYGSSIELDTQLIIISDLGYKIADDIVPLRGMLFEMNSILSGLRRSIKSCGRTTTN